MRVPAALLFVATLGGFSCPTATAQEDPIASSTQESSPPLAASQSPNPPQSQSQGESSSLHPEWRAERREMSSLPDAPQPQHDDHERSPCPEGEFKPCAILGGKPYIRDRLRMTQHDKTVWQGFKHPMVLAGTALLVASTIYDIEGTQSCLRAGTCRETNPFYGSHPSRARAYSIAMPLNGVLIYLSARQKRKGDGNTAFAALYLSSIVHFYFGRSAYSAAGAHR